MFVRNKMEIITQQVVFLRRPCEVEHRQRVERVCDEGKDVVFY